jgi:hypothetical protein
MSFERRLGGVRKKFCKVLLAEVQFERLGEGRDREIKAEVQ